MESFRDEISMGGIQDRYDAVVVGAGPGGCAAAASLAVRGATVLLVESNPRAARRFAGEWIHPAGVRVLRELGLIDDLDPSVSSRGFAVLPNDGLGPIELDYPDGEGLCCEHATLVRHLRERVSELHGVHYVEGVRARLDRDDVVELATDRSERMHVFAKRAIVAAGRSYRKARAVPAGVASISQMAGLIITDATLPFEGYGHVILGGPGPALAYRIDDQRVRLCLDVPSSIRPGARTTTWLGESFTEVLPRSLRNGFRDSLARAPVAWASNSFGPREYDGARAALVGDAAGFFHPLTAMGITMSVLDAESAARDDAREHHAARRARETHVPELLSNAIYQAFARDDPGSLAIRNAILRTWRANDAERRRTMRLLAADDTNRAEFLRAFAIVAARAGAHAAVRNPEALRGLVSWLRWPWASLRAHRELRRRSVSWAAPESWSTRGRLGPLMAWRERQHAN